MFASWALIILIQVLMITSHLWLTHLKSIGLASICVFMSSFFRVYLSEYMREGGRREEEGRGSSYVYSLFTRIKKIFFFFSFHSSRFFFISSYLNAVKLRWTIYEAFFFSCRQERIFYVIYLFRLLSWRVSNKVFGKHFWFSF